MQFFIGLHMQKFTADEMFIDRFYAKSFINFIHGLKPCEDWLPFDPVKRNYYSVKANLKRRIFPRNEMNYHTDVADYWLLNMTQFDKTLPHVALTEMRYDLVDITPVHSIYRPLVSALLFVLTLAVLFFTFMAVYKALSWQPSLNHEQMPLMHWKATETNQS
ncbi:hypothetical protein COOONC_05382 [Cooperia oncophora]